MTRQIWGIVALITAVQFFNIIDFMIVMPLGPDFALAFGAPVDQVPWVATAYILSASITAFASARYLDRFRRRPLMVSILLGLAMAEGLAAQAPSFHALLGFRALAGVFGGLATSISMAIISESVPPAFRGRAMGFSGSAFALSSIIGVPLGLELSLIGGWQLPFYALSAVMLLMALATRFALPDNSAPPRRPWPGTWRFIRRKKTLYAYALLATVSGGSFLLIPSFATYMQFNLGFPRERMSEIYFVAGVATLIAQQITGWALDRYRMTYVAWVGFGCIAMSLIGGFMSDPPWLSIWVFFPLFMVSGAARIVAANTASSLVPEAHERAAHMALQGSIRHGCSGLAAFASSIILTVNIDGSLNNVAALATVTLVVALAQPLIMARLEPMLDRR
ncbi:MFS transporter [Litorivicinus lipolyticus]|uniref:MFS transporter n=1 Tax=Litorivicinus lipolyticus TaxID=418701 RepID=UPI003B5962A1